MLGLASRVDCTIEMIRICQRNRRDYLPRVLVRDNKVLVWSQAAACQNHRKFLHGFVGMEFAARNIYLQPG